MNGTTAAPRVPVGPTGLPTGITEPGAFLYQRVTLYLRVMVSFVCLLYLFGWVGAIAGQLDPIALHLEPSKLLHLGMMCGLTATWWWCRQRERSPTTMRAVEIGATAAVAVAMTTVLFVAPDFVPSAIMLFLASTIVSLVLVVRAAMVPSMAMQAVLVGIPASAVVAIGGYFNYQGPVAFGMPPALPGMGIPFMAGLIFTAAGAIVSKTIYGLHADMRQAMQLGQYTLEHKIGEGGMGAVYRARHALLRRPTAIKLLPPEKAGAQAIARFEQEVQQTARLTHPNTVSIYDFGYTADGVFYYAMEYLDGLSLEDLVAVAGPLPPGRVVYLLEQVADALAEAHGAGLVHRDIKPANILVCESAGRQDVAKVVDFGLVKDVERSGDLKLTEANVITGTPHYLAPEVLASPDAVSPQADIYALGGVLYFCLTGELVFEGASLVEICGHHLHSEPQPPSKRAQDVPADLEAVAMRCLAKKPGDRFADVAALREALLDCACASDWSRAAALGWWQEHRSTIEASRAEQVATAPTERAGRMTVALAKR